MMSVLERKSDEPTAEEFVSAVIQMHERIRSELRTVLAGKAPRNTGEASVEAEVIRAYNLSHGVDPEQIKKSQRVEPRWPAASAR